MLEASQGGVGTWASGLEKQLLTPSAKVLLTSGLGGKPQRPICKLGQRVEQKGVSHR